MVAVSRAILEDIEANGRTGKYDFTRHPEMQKQMELEYALREEHAVPLSKELFPNNEEFRILKNTYPYAVAPGETIDHYIIWLNPKVYTWDYASKYTIKPNMRPGYTIFSFANPKELRTVPDVPHIHMFFVKDK